MSSNRKHPPSLSSLKSKPSSTITRLKSKNLERFVNRHPSKKHSSRKGAALRQNSGHRNFQSPKDKDKSKKRLKWNKKGDLQSNFRGFRPMRHAQRSRKSSRTQSPLTRGWKNYLYRAQRRNRYWVQPKNTRPLTSQKYNASIQSATTFSLNSNRYLVEAGYRQSSRLTAYKIFSRTFSPKRYPHKLPSSLRALRTRKLSSATRRRVQQSRNARGQRIGLPTNGLRINKYRYRRAVEAIKSTRKALRRNVVIGPLTERQSRAGHPSEQLLPAAIASKQLPLQLRLQAAPRATKSAALTWRLLSPAFRLHDRRKRYLRARRSKRPGMKKPLKTMVASRQLLRKLRALRFASTRALRLRLLRHKRRHHSKRRTLLHPLPPTRYRLKRRAVRRAKRFLRSTVTILRGARAHTLQRRATSRQWRAAQPRTKQLGRALFARPQVVAALDQTRRQQLFIFKEVRRRARAARLLSVRPATEFPIVSKTKGQSWLKRHHLFLRTRRALLARTSTLAPRRLPIHTHFAPKSATNLLRWVTRRQRRIHRTSSLDRRHLSTPLEVLQQQIVRREVRLQLPSRTQSQQVSQARAIYPSARQQSAVIVGAVGAKVGTSTLTKANVSELLYSRKPALQPIVPIADGATQTVLAASTMNAQFLHNAQKSQLTRRPRKGWSVAFERAAVLAMRGERARQLETRYYRSRPKFRLPEREIPGGERQQEGLRLFARHTLKQPKTLRGKGKLLLPATDVYTATAGSSQPESMSYDRDLRLPKRLSHHRPRVWFPTLTRHEGKLAASNEGEAMHRKHRHALKRRLGKRTRFFPEIAPRTSIHTFQRLGTLIFKTKEMSASDVTRIFFKKLTFATKTQEEAAKALFLTRLQTARLNVSARALSAKIPKKEGQRHAVRSAVIRQPLTIARRTNEKKREDGLWHLRSVQAMQDHERTLSAWSPQYSVRDRRWSSPRSYGLLIWPRVISKDTRKRRRNANLVRQERSLPTRKYVDRAFAQLQYFRGSAATIGYARYRRVYRPKSKNNRWWKPMNQPVPFTNPYSRRALNSKKITPTQLDHQFGVRTGSQPGRTRSATVTWFTPEIKPRSVLSITYKFDRRHWETDKQYAYRVELERSKMPRMIQQWIFDVLNAPVDPIRQTSHKGLLLARTRRSERKLEQLFPRYNVWAGQRWTGLHESSSPTSAAALFATASQVMLKNFWLRLRTSIGVSESLKLQRAVFSRLRSWQALTSTTPLVGTPDYKQYLTRAAKFIVTAVAEIRGYATPEMTHAELQSNAFARRFTNKQNRFWKLRQLADQKVGSIYDKNNHALRRRWLHGAERYLKRSRVGRLPARHRRGGSHRMVNYGRERRRFPASGRKRKSYDSMLHAFAKKVSPSRFRRAATLRFQQVRPKINQDSKVNRQKYALTPRRRVQRKLAHALGRVAYLSSAWRELLAFRANSPVTLPTTDFAASAIASATAESKASVKSQVSYSAQYGQPFDLASKRRFVSLPINVIFKRKQQTERLLRSRQSQGLRAHRTGLLRVALRRRRTERAFQKLKARLMRRRPMRERAIALWRLRRLARKRMKYSQYGVWSYRQYGGTKTTGPVWTLHDIEERAPRRQDRALCVDLRSTHGESLLLAPQPAKKRDWAKKGFRIQLTQPELPVRRARINRRQRRPRTSGRAPVYLRHWVETASYKRYLKPGIMQKRTWMKTTSKQFLRSRTTLLSRATYKVRSLFSKSQNREASKTVNRLAPLSSAVLPRFSTLRRLRGVPRLQRRAAYRRNRLLRRRTDAYRRSLQARAISDRARVAAKQQAVRALRPFTENTRAPAALAPLTFLRRTKRVVKSEAQKLRAVIWNIKSKEIRFKRTAQYADGLSKFLPALMSYMLSHRIARKKLTFTLVKSAIAVTYWNLRVHLNVDPFEKRLTLRDHNFNTLRYLAVSMARRAKEQITAHINRIHLRWRFQPFRLQRAAGTDRGREDWLRLFFPRQHALFQEDPIRYRRLQVSSRNVHRVGLEGYGVANVKTSGATNSIEHRARRVLQMRFSTVDRRLETVLQTERRLPEKIVAELVPAVPQESKEEKIEKARTYAARTLAEDLAANAAEFARSKKFVFVKKTRKPKLSRAEIAEATANVMIDAHHELWSPTPLMRTPFFQRAYSITTARTVLALSKLIAQQVRVSSPEGKDSSPFLHLSARNRVKDRISARDRTNFIASPTFMINAGGLDPRFLRYKSPRSRQYGLRVPTRIEKFAKSEKIIKLIDYRKKCATLWPAPAERGLLRLRRRHISVPLPKVEATESARLVAAARASSILRRNLVALRSRATLLAHASRRSEHHNFPNRRQLMFTPVSFHKRAQFLRREKRVSSTAPLRKNQLLSHWQAMHRTALDSERSILSYRTAAQRTVHYLPKVDRVIGYRPLRLKKGPRLLAQVGRRAFKLLRRANSKYAKKDWGAFARFMPTPTASKLATEARTERKHLALKQAAAKFLRRFRARESKTFLPRGRTILTRHADGQLRLSKEEKQISSEDRKHFRVRAGHRIARLARFTKRCMTRQRVEHLTSFDSFRPKLWYMLTSRWTKKHRMLKEWLKHVNLWFKDSWLSEHVDVIRRETRVTGDIRAREIREGESQAKRSAQGYTRAEVLAGQENKKVAIKAAEKVVAKDTARAMKKAATIRGLEGIKIRARVKRSAEVVKKARPSMWLANLQYQRFAAEKAEWLKKTKAEKQAFLLEKKQKSIARVKAGKSRLAPRFLPLKFPANHFIPYVIWKDIHRRLRRLTWRESDDEFVRRGYRNAFRFYPAERNRAPWLESLMYNRSMYSTNLKEFRRRQFPKEQKKYKWLQRVRKSLFPGRTNTYIKGRRWPRLRIYNQKLHYTLFNLPDRNAARRHFKKLNGRSRTIGFVHAQQGLSNRLDNVLIHMNLAPTIFWARSLAKRRLLRVNGTIVWGADYRLKAGDYLEPRWAELLKYRHFFTAPMSRRAERYRHQRWSRTGVSRNFKYHPGLRTYTYLGPAREEELRRSTRLQPQLFRWFRLDSGAKKSIT